MRKRLYVESRTAPSLAKKIASMFFVTISCSVGLVCPAYGDERLDSWKAAKAKIEIATSQAGTVKDVSVDVLHGHATIAGKVPITTDVSKIEDALKAMDGVSDVRSLLERAAYVPPQPDDPEILRQVRVELAGKSLRVEGVTDGIVAISGSSPSLLEQVESFQRILEIDGVRGIQSSAATPKQLYTDETRQRWLRRKRTGKPMPGAFQDFWITGAVKLGLASNPDVQAESVYVDTRNAIVTLFGVVASQDARTGAQQEAETIQLVERVENDIQVDPRIHLAVSSASAPEIEAELREALRDYGPLSTMDISVSVTDGVATITGVSKSDEHALAATLLARSVDGVRSVHNELKAAPP